MKIALDVHTHTLASGHAFSTLQEMARAAADKGLEVLGITEHSPGIPGTCDPIYFRNLHVVPRRMYGIELLLGAEINSIICSGWTCALPVSIRSAITGARWRRIRTEWCRPFPIHTSTSSVIPVTGRPN